MADNVSMRSRTPQDDFYSDKHKIYQKYKPFFDLITDAMTVSGGLIGTGGGSAVPGPGNVAGGIGGSALGRSGGKAIENLFISQLGLKPELSSLPKAAVEGAAAEMSGRALSGVISRALQGMRPTESTLKIKELPEVDSRIEYHASPGSQIPEPRTYFTQNTSHGKSFHTTPQRDVAEAIGYGKTHKAISKGQMPPETKPEISEYYPIKMGDESSVNIKSIQDIHDLARKVGMSEDDVAYLDGKYIEYLKRGLNPDTALDFTYSELSREAAILNSPVNVASKGVVPTSIWGDMLKDRGIRKLEKPLSGMLSPQDREIISFYPEKDLYYKPLYDMLSNQNKLIMQQRAADADMNRKIDNAQRLTDILSRALSAQQQ